MGASAFNQAMEISNDSRMKRTMRRPLVAGKISKSHALTAASLSSIGGVTLLAAYVNPLTAGLAAANVGLYALIYTPMKQHSKWNTWVGAIVGKTLFIVFHVCL
jgi:protoheme IX farnesyltransferase